MLEAMRNWSDNLLGRGAAATTIPIFDGPLKPNNVIEEAQVFSEVAEAEDMATDGRFLYVAAGRELLRTSPIHLKWERHATFEGRITAIACSTTGGVAVAIEGKAVRIIGGELPGLLWTNSGGIPFTSVNALTFGGGSLYATEGSQDRSSEEWCFDLMEKGRTGRVVELTLGKDGAKDLASGLEYSFGVQVVDGQVWHAESWKHRVLRRSAGTEKVVIENLPGYPSRMAPAKGGGVWLSVFTCRTQLVEFVLREPEYRARMMAEVDPRYWIAPALSSGHSFLEPLQGAGVKQMGYLKPWAPPRSYGLIVRLDGSGRPTISLHSRVGGANHGIVALCELGDSLFMLSKGSQRVLRCAISAIEKGEGLQ